MNETLQFSLPDGVFACDMAVFTIWCRGARTQFTALDIPPELFVSLQSSRHHMYSILS